MFFIVYDKFLPLIEQETSCLQKLLDVFKEKKKKKWIGVAKKFN